MDVMGIIEILRQEVRYSRQGIKITQINESVDVYKLPYLYFKETAIRSYPYYVGRLLRTCLEVIFKNTRYTLEPDEGGSLRVKVYKPSTGRYVNFMVFKPPDIQSEEKIRKLINEKVVIAYAKYTKKHIHNPAKPTGILAVEQAHSHQANNPDSRRHDQRVEWTITDTYAVHRDTQTDRFEWVYDTPTQTESQRTSTETGTEALAIESSSEDSGGGF